MVLDDRVRFMQGNEACAEGALAAGLRFYAGYPITPSSEIMEILSRRLPVVGGKFIQMEDEIASLAAVIGASIGGLKSMTATSGPGFSLMQEHIGFAAMTEIPCVIVDVQRVGPSTGVATAPAQGDVMQARWGTHGDHPIIALSPSSVRETFDLAITAFNFSEKFRSPVILLMDEVVAHMRERVLLPAPEEIKVVERLRATVPPEWYYPYEETDTDVPPMVSFGEGYRYNITGLFHDKAGFPTLRLDEINPLIERMFRKIDRNRHEIIIHHEENLEDAEFALVAYGSTVRSARQAMQLARERGWKVGLVRLSTIWPFAEEVIDSLAERVKFIVVPEMNLGQLILEVQRVSQGRARVVGVNRADGEMISPFQILDVLREAVNGEYVTPNIRLSEAK